MKRYLITGLLIASGFVAGYTVAPKTQVRPEHDPFLCEVSRTADGEMNLYVVGYDSWKTLDELREAMKRNPEAFPGKEYTLIERTATIIK